MPAVRWFRFLASLAAMLAIAVAGCLGAARFTIAEDWVSIGLYSSVYVMVVVACYVVASLWNRWPVLRHALFWSLLTIVEIPFVLAGYFPSPAGFAYEGDQLARMFILPIAVGGLLAYSVDRFSGISSPRQLTRPPDDVCPSCGYPIGSSRVCTECGKELNKAP